MVVPIFNKKIPLTYQVPLDFPEVFIQKVKNIENEKEKLNTVFSESEVRQKKSLKLQAINKPLWCGSCQVEQDPDYPTPYCQSCQKDPWYGSHKPWVKPEEIGLYKMDEEFEMFKQYMKFKKLSLEEKKDE